MFFPKKLKLMVVFASIVGAAGILMNYSNVANAGEVTRTGRNGRSVTIGVDREYDRSTGEINTTRTGPNGRSLNSTYSIDRSTGEVDAVHTTGNGRVLRSTTRTGNREETEVNGQGVNGRNINILKRR